MARKKDLFVTKKNSPMEKAAKLVELQALKKEIDAQIGDIKQDLLEVTQNLGVLTLKTDKYTISRGRRVTPQVTDFKTLKKSLDDNNIPYETQEVFADFMSVTFKKLIEDGRELDGLEGKETEYISVRVKEKEDQHDK